MDYLLVCTTALIVAALTLFSGFGLGTLLMPVFAIFFPVEVAITATAAVHLANNVFKLVLVGRHANWGIVARFALPAAVAAFGGAWLLKYIGKLPGLATVSLAGVIVQIEPVKLAIGALIITFALFDLLPPSKRTGLSQKYLPVGGALSGFFGGLSGHQGALRSAFLIRLGLDRHGFIGTTVICAVMVDVSRLLVYGLALLGPQQAPTATGDDHQHLLHLVAAAAGAAFVGSFVGTRLIQKVTIQLIQRVVAAMLIALGAGLILGVV